MVKLKIALLLIVILSACSDGTKNNNRTKEKSSDINYVSQKPTKFKVDPFWPKFLPNNWILGEVSGLAVDATDNVWIIHRPGTLTERETGAAQNPPLSECCSPAPSVIEFDPQGNVIQAWGSMETMPPWPESEHGIYVDDAGNVWIGGRNPGDHVVLKFSNDGSLLLQIGEWGVINGSNDTLHLGAPTDFAVDTNANEVYIADGYANRRIIVFDATTGEYKRHWGAYGNTPDDSVLRAYEPNEEPTKTFRGPVHSVGLSSDDMVYVTDRMSDRIQIFKKDGTFIKEFFIAKQTRGVSSAWDIEFSKDADQTYMYITDGMNRKIWILDRLKLEVVGSFGSGGRNAGQFGWVHSLAMDSKGNLYTSEVNPGKRVQKFRPVDSTKE